MSISIDELSSIYGMYGVNGLTSNNQTVNAVSSDKAATDGDSYISEISGMDINAAIPSENYNDLGRQLKAAAQASASSDSTEYAAAESSSAAAVNTTQTQDTEETSSAGGAGGGGGSSSDDEETETTVVTINGQTYLQTTTTDSDGNVTVTRVPVGGQPSGSEAANGTLGISPAAEALASL